MIDLIHRLFVIVTRSGTTPANWRDARVVPVPKSKGSSTDPKDFRPIAILPILRRLYEVLVLQPSLRPDLHLRQFGFRDGASTLDAAIIAGDTIAISRTPMVLLDVAKAFDTVDHTLLSGALVASCDPLSARLQLSLLASQVTVTSQGRTSTASFSTTRGVPQGSHLSPTQYDLFVDPLVRELNRHPSRAGALFFADDQALLQSPKEHLQSQLDLCERFSISHVFNYNATKSMVLTTAPSTLQIAGQDIPTVTKATYLGFPFVAGVGLDSRQLAHSKMLSAQRASSIIFRFRQAQCTYVPLLRQLYLTYVRPCFFYGSQIAGYTQGQVELMQKVENGCLRAILRCPRSTSTEAMGYLLRIPPVYDQTDYLMDTWGFRVSNLPPDHPTTISCELSAKANRGQGRHILSTGNSIKAEKYLPKRPKEDPKYWEELARASKSTALKSLVVIIPPKKPYFGREILTLHGPAGHALRLWLLQRLHPIRHLRTNPTRQQLPPHAEQALSEVANVLNTPFSNSAIRIRPSMTTLDPTSNLIRMVFVKFPAPKQADKRKDLLTRIGTALHQCREHLSTPAEDPESDSEPDSETEPAELSEPDDDPSEDDDDYSEHDDDHPEHEDGDTVTL